MRLSSPLLYLLAAHVGARCVHCQTLEPLLRELFRFEYRRYSTLVGRLACSGQFETGAGDDTHGAGIACSLALLACVYSKHSSLGGCLWLMASVR